MWVNLFNQFRPIKTSFHEEKKNKVLESHLYDENSDNKLNKMKNLLTCEKNPDTEIHEI